MALTAERLGPSCYSLLVLLLVGVVALVDIIAVGAVVVVPPVSCRGSGCSSSSCSLWLLVSCIVGITKHLLSDITVGSGAITARCS